MPHFPWAPSRQNHHGTNMHQHGESTQQDGAPRLGNSHGTSFGERSAERPPRRGSATGQVKHLEQAERPTPGIRGRDTAQSPQSRTPASRTLGSGLTTPKRTSAIRSLPQSPMLGISRHDPREARQAQTSRRHGQQAQRVEPLTATQDDGPVSVVVVDNDLVGYAHASEHDRAGALLEPGSNGVDVPTSGSSPRDKSGKRPLERKAASLRAASVMDMDSDDRPQSGWEWWLRQRVIPPIRRFCTLRFDNREDEAAYRLESWKSEKAGAFLCSGWIMITWVLQCVFRGQWPPWSWGIYFGLAGAFTIPLPFLVIFDGPRRCPWIYQVCLLGAAWWNVYTLAVEMYMCDFFNSTVFRGKCPNRTFLYMGTAAYSSTSMALVGMRQNRVLHAAAATGWFILQLVEVTPLQRAARSFIRDLCIFITYHWFLAVASYWREWTSRRVFTLSLELQDQIDAVREAECMEREAQESKRRFVSYIFHEVRVPLNAALLAVQNLEDEGLFANADADQHEMVHGLIASLALMENVLNDVLSFNRMEAGNLVLACKPFDLHQTMQVIGLSHRVQAEVAKLDLILDLDPRIDELGTMLGDEMRLRQVASNFVSNAIKFTPEGSVRIVTKLLYVHITKVHDDTDTNRSSLSADPEKGSAPAEAARNSPSCKTCCDGRNGAAIIRIEVHDTGVGLRPVDVLDNALFSPYVQTEIGRRQGGKGSGLGLALCMQIVKLSHGRIGVESQHGKGSMFWFEVPYHLPPRKGATEEAFIHPMLAASAPVERTTSHNPHPPASPRKMSGLTRRLSNLRNSLLLRSPSDDSGRDVSSEQNGNRRPSVDTPLSPKVMLERFPTRISVTQRGHFGTSPLDPPRALPANSPGASESHGDQGAPKGTALGLHISQPHMFATPPPDQLNSGRAVSPGISESGPVPARASPRVPQYSPSTLPAVLPSPRRTPRAIAYPSLPELAEVSQGGCTPPRIPPLSTAPTSPASPTSPATFHSTTRSSADLISRSLPCSPRPEAAPLSVLVVDDDLLTRRLMHRMISRLGHDVTVAENGQVALDLLKTGHPYDIVFLDNQMPLLSGVEVVRELRNWPSNVYVIGCTGNALLEDQDEYLNAGADGLITKPVNQAAIVRHLGEAQRRRQREPRLQQSL